MNLCSHQQRAFRGCRVGGGQKGTLNDTGVGGGEGRRAAGGRGLRHQVTEKVGADGGAFAARRRWTFVQWDKVAVMVVMGANA